MIYFCSQKNRRDAVLASATLNGIDYVEVVGPCGCGTELAVTFLKDPRSLSLTPTNFILRGDTTLTAVGITPPPPDDPLVLTVILNATGDFSKYALAIVADATCADPPDGLDPMLSTVDFSFKAGCPTPADCLPTNCCPPPSRPAPDINYLAKDYEAFRQVMLDRVAALAPTWAETHAADLGVGLVEALAYVADRLSYQQDAVSTEAYVGTARSRISLRRHARLVDYVIGEGSNARTWVHVEAQKQATLPQHSQFYVLTPGIPAVVSASDPRVTQLKASVHPIFESLEKATVYPENNSLNFYTWGDGSCCLPAGATRATLIGTASNLAAGHVLIFKEVMGPITGDPGDADPTHRWAVRLTSVSTTDHKGRLRVDPIHPTQNITLVEWAVADALPFPLCISSTSQAGVLLGAVSVALGNNIAADHGTSAPPESLGTVPPAPPMPTAGASCDCDSSSATAAASRPRYYPELSQTTLTFARPYHGLAPASALAVAAATPAVPQIRVDSDDGGSWTAQPDLLSSGGAARNFVPEIESNGTVFLRFGDGTYGEAPDTGVSFTAHYRVGNGAVGNIGPDSLAHTVFEPGVIRSVTNPLPAAGGTDPETMEHIRQWAPFAFETQLRCVTEADYGQAAIDAGSVADARGTLRWTGSWYTAFVSLDPVGALTSQLISQTTQSLNLRRMMGTDLAVEGAVIVGLKLQMQICVAPDHFVGDVYTALMKLFITGNQCAGASGMLNASNFTFGATIYASPLIAAAQSVDGVVSATLVTFTRMDDPTVDGVTQGYLTMGRLELARCDNDPNHLDHGTFELLMDGGK